MLLAEQMQKDNDEMTAQSEAHQQVAELFRQMEAKRWSHPPPY
ncbi:hypothetical protein OROGR_021558 [Orobanche gracilis]